MVPEALAGQAVPVGPGLLWAPPQGGLELPAILVVLAALEDLRILSLLWIQEFLGSQLILGNPLHPLSLSLLWILETLGHLFRVYLVHPSLPPTLEIHHCQVPLSGRVGLSCQAVQEDLVLL